MIRPGCSRSPRCCSPRRRRRRTSRARPPKSRTCARSARSSGCRPQWGYRALAGDWKGMAALGTDDVRWSCRAATPRAARRSSSGCASAWAAASTACPPGRLNLRLYFSPVITLARDGRPRDRALAPSRADSARTASRPTGSAPPTWSSTARPPKAGGSPFIRPYGTFAGTYEEGWRTTPATLERAPYHYTPDEAGRCCPTAPPRTPRGRRTWPGGHPAAARTAPRRTSSTPTATTSTAGCTTTSPTCSRPTPRSMSPGRASTTAPPACGTSSAATARPGSTRASSTTGRS